jgi:hypothetical protein
MSFDTMLNYHVLINSSNTTKLTKKKINNLFFRFQHQVPSSPTAVTHTSSDVPLMNASLSDGGDTKAGTSGLIVTYLYWCSDPTHHTTRTVVLVLAADVVDIQAPRTTRPAVPVAVGPHQLHVL